MKLLSFTVTNELFTEYYSPVIRIHYSENALYCTRLVVQDRTSKQWIFLENRGSCPSALARLLDIEYDRVIEVRRSSRPPPPK